MAWAILAIALFGVSSGGPLLASMDTPPVLRASWRLWATSIVLLPGFMVQLRRAENEIYDLRNISMILLSGFALAIHFAAWTWSLDHTSLAHSLLFVTSHPIVIVSAMFVIERKADPLLICGASLGFMGAGLALLDASDSGSVTYAGDAAAFLGAVAGAAYLAIGRILRSGSKIPLFIYAFPVTTVSAIILTGLSASVESTASTIDAHPLGWIGSEYFLTVVALAFGAGLLGHTGLNAALRWLPPIIISVGLLFEPILGSVIGLLVLGTIEVGFWTVLGGIMMIVGAIILTFWLESRIEPRSTS
ncbi:MAG TPA: DMT family transporter [Candidatus Poseidoniales archaeon]|nr:MAG TPA: DMT family transporter [Candidatus Poseidoniales archaeon]DAC27056.1 MAG TPA: DMT family transporter [Candidatus Poseidoniales archaeon]|tara:strand:- start:1572 stop:2483 length:912 start_codon:yes stop_codon:yes gene_type:complete